MNREKAVRHNEGVFVKELVKLNDEGFVPPLLKENWKRSHWCDPIIAAQKHLLFERSFQQKGRSYIIGVVVFLVAGAFLDVVPAWLGSPVGTAVALLPISAAIAWALAHGVAMLIEHHSGLGAVDENLFQEAGSFARHFLELLSEAQKSIRELAQMDLKVLAEELLVIRAARVLVAEEKIGQRGKEDFLDTSAYHEKVIEANAFKSLYDTLKELGLVSEEGYKRFYTQAQKLREQEKKSAVADVVVNTGISHTMF